MDVPGHDGLQPSPLPRRPLSWLHVIEPLVTPPLQIFAPSPVLFGSFRLGSPRMSGPSSRSASRKLLAMPLWGGFLGSTPSHEHHRFPTPPWPAPSPGGEPVAPKRPSPIPRKASISCSRRSRKASVPSSRLRLLPPCDWALAQRPRSCSRAPPWPPPVAPKLHHLSSLPFPLSLSLSLPHLRTTAELPSPILHPSQLVPRVRGSKGCVHGSQPCMYLASSLSARLQTSALAPLGQLPSASAPFGLNSPRPAPLGQLPSALAPLGLVWLPSPAPANSPQPQLLSASFLRPQLPSVSAPLGQLPLISYDSHLQLLLTALGLSSLRPQLPSASSP